MITAAVLVVGLVAREMLRSSSHPDAAYRQELVERFLVPFGVAFLIVAAVLVADLGGILD